MPRTSRPRSSSPAPVASHSRELSQTLASHGSLLTILWVVLLCLSLGGGLVLLKQTIEIKEIEQQVMNVEMEALEAKTQVLTLKQEQMTDVLKQAMEPTSTTGMGSASAGTSTASPAVNQQRSPSGALDRGSLSPDGTKYAGYNDTVAGKIGIAVEVKDATRPKYIVIFNTKTESTGLGTPMETQMSVRWSDAQTIEYDVLVTKNGQQAKETRSIKIYF